MQVKEYYISGHFKISSYLSSPPQVTQPEWPTIIPALLVFVLSLWEVDGCP